ncbi:MAG: hypothetical protein WB611_00075 [Stellaceae bacterium]
MAARAGARTITPSLAARLQALAGPNTLIIGEATRRHIGRLFDLEDLGTQRLNGADIAGRTRRHRRLPSQGAGRSAGCTIASQAVRAAGNDGATERFLSRFLDHLHDTDNAARGLAPLHYPDMNSPGRRRARKQAG